MSVKKVKRYCEYCKKETEHEIEGENTDGNEAGRCLICGSSHMTQIQGFCAALM